MINNIHMTIAGTAKPIQTIQRYRVQGPFKLAPHVKILGGIISNTKSIFANIGKLSVILNKSENEDLDLQSLIRPILRGLNSKFEHLHKLIESAKADGLHAKFPPQAKHELKILAKQANALIRHARGLCSDPRITSLFEELDLKADLRFLEIALKSLDQNQQESKSKASDPKLTCDSKPITSIIRSIHQPNPSNRLSKIASEIFFNIRDNEKSLTSRLSASLELAEDIQKVLTLNLNELGSRHIMESRNHIANALDVLERLDAKNLDGETFALLASTLDSLANIEVQLDKASGNEEASIRDWINRINASISKPNPQPKPIIINKQPAPKTKKQWDPLKAFTSAVRTLGKETVQAINSTIKTLMERYLGVNPSYDKLSKGFDAIVKAMVKVESSKERLQSQDYEVILDKLEKAGDRILALAA